MVSVLVEGELPHLLDAEKGLGHLGVAGVDVDGHAGQLLPQGGHAHGVVIVGVGQEDALHLPPLCTDGGQDAGIGVAGIDDGAALAGLIGH